MSRPEDSRNAEGFSVPSPRWRHCRPTPWLMLCLCLLLGLATGCVGTSDDDDDDSSGGASDSGSGGQAVSDGGMAEPATIVDLAGRYDIKHTVDIDEDSCADGRWTGQLTYECSPCFDEVNGPSARAFLWQYEADRWTDLGTVPLTLSESVDAEFDLTMVEGFTCRDLATALIFFPTAEGLYGREKVLTLRKGASTGFGRFPSTQGEGSDYFLSCDPERAVRAELVVYDYLRQTTVRTIELTYRPPDGPSNDDWFATTDRLMPSEIVALLAYDADGAIICSTFL